MKKSNNCFKLTPPQLLGRVIILGIGKPKKAKNGPPGIRTATSWPNSPLLPRGRSTSPAPAKAWQTHTHTQTDTRTLIDSAESATQMRPKLFALFLQCMLFFLAFPSLKTSFPIIQIIGAKKSIIITMIVHNYI